MIELILAATIHYLPGDWNERHPGIRYERAPFMAAAFHNSEGDLSLAAGLVGRHEIAPGVNLFGELAIVTGYEAAPIVPMVRAGLEAGAHHGDDRRGLVAGNDRQLAEEVDAWRYLVTADQAGGQGQVALAVVEGGGHERRALVADARMALVPVAGQVVDGCGQDELDHGTGKKRLK